MSAFTFAAAAYKCKMEWNLKVETIRVRPKYQTMPIIGLHSLLRKKGDCLCVTRISFPADNLCLSHYVIPERRWMPVVHR